MYDDDDDLYEDGLLYEDEDPLYDDDFLFFDDVPEDFDDIGRMPDDGWEPRRAKTDGHPAEDFKRDILDLFLCSLLNENAVRDAGPIELLYVLQLYKEFMKKTQTDPPRGLYRTALKAAELYDELFPHGTY